MPNHLRHRDDGDNRMMAALLNRRTDPHASGVLPPQRSSEPPILLNTTEAAALLSISRTTLYELMWSGQITAVHIGRSIRFPRVELESFVARLTDQA